MPGSQATDRARPRVPAQAAPDLPDRYRVARDSAGSMLTCIEAPTVTVRIRFGVTATAAAARNSAPGSIFLDGAAHGAPFLDTKREVYNLDHHEGCVRPFTLATCEQAMVLLRRGLDLRKREWTVYGNDADLDTVLAVWVLLNHIRLNDRDPETRTRVMPLLRLQGMIDAQGLELRDLCGLPSDVMAETQAWIDGLRARELSLKERGRWQERDLTEHVAERLRAIDRLVYQPDHFDDLQEIEQLARVEIARGSIAVVCRAKAGIYEVERELRRLHGKRLGVIVLQTRSSVYSLRQVNPYLPATLEKVYTHLNLIDPAAGGRKAANRWGGSAEIGGSPRATGTPLRPEQIAEACRLAFQAPSLVQRVRRVASTVAGSAGIMLAVLAGAFPMGLPADAESIPAVAASHLALLLTGLGGALLILRALRAPGLYGFRRPAGFDWCALIPVALAGAVAGGVWVPAGGLALEPAWPDLLSVLVLPLGAELLFRGLVQGSLITSFAIQECDGRWFLSWPSAIAAALYALWTVVLQHPWVGLADPLAGAAHVAIPITGALVFGAAAGVARERSESVASAILLHWVCIIVALLVR